MVNRTVDAVALASSYTEKKKQRGYPYDQVDIKRILEKYNLTQEQFVAMLGIRMHSLRNRKQGLNVPEDPAMGLQQAADKHPQAVLDAVENMEERRRFLP